MFYRHFSHSLPARVDHNTRFEMGMDEIIKNVDLPDWYRVLFWMLKYVSPSMVFVSLIMNGATFMVFSSKEYRHSLDAMLRKFLAVSDATVVVLSDGFHTLSLRISGISIVTYNSITCKIIGTVHLMLRALSAWILVLIALERVIGICFPHRSKVLNTKRRFVWLLLGISVVILALYSPLFDCLGHASVSPENSVDTCTLSCSSDLSRWYGRVFYSWMNIIMTCGLPSFWIIVFNVAIIWSLIISSRRFAQPAANPGARTNNSQVAILITVSVTFVVLSTPMAVYFCFIAYVQNNGVLPAGVTLQQLLMLGNFAPVFDSIHHSIYFIFYCLCGTKFRKCFINQLRSACKMCRFANRPCLFWEKDIISRWCLYHVKKTMIHMTR